VVVPLVIAILSRVVKTNFSSVGYQVEKGGSQGTQAFQSEKTGPASKEDLLAVEGFSRRRNPDLGQAL
jgi:hypothetical protein